MSRLRVHVVCEYGIDMRPHASSFIRLLRPLSHPSISDAIRFTWGIDYFDEPADVVIVDRLWRPDVNMALAKRLVHSLKRAGARLIYNLDDDLLSLPPNAQGWPSREHKDIVRFFLENADAVLVTTERLARHLQGHCQRLTVLTNALDERLIANAGIAGSRVRRADTKVVIGIMGTRTHLQDLRLIIPALREVYGEYAEKVEFQCVGVADSLDIKAAFGDIPVRIIQPLPHEEEYPLFMLWFTSEVAWDIALAPLVANHFNRCKSDIKLLDYAAIGAAGIYSDLEPYRAVIHRAEAGLLVENTADAWVEALQTLIEDEHARERLSVNARNYLYKHRTLQQRARQWPLALQATLSS
jgi:glycosyltransferase involved in cell wall biosynthesis